MSVAALLSDGFEEDASGPLPEKAVSVYCDRWQLAHRIELTCKVFESYAREIKNFCMYHRSNADLLEAMTLSSRILTVPL